MTRLRKMMLEELQRRNYSAITTRKYRRVVSDFAKRHLQAVTNPLDSLALSSTENIRRSFKRKNEK